ncbi:hypothetical protein SAMN02745248_02443 [Hathewaya proteolytica DSM 3090]|uniref:Uncharacterized protein n=1 Tax=Hathewaya proteolytica DSM 3090 TaxID=1121331 RepID=A0A1M6S3N6_9CLOT|nr:hypothetical protein [Hathewaya proteolytica]SHK39249.1 hypothetical protein SAMN02745248_02443 [Hathewaya proteolytica DSM 3090]
MTKLEILDEKLLPNLDTFLLEQCIKSLLDKTGEYPGLLTCSTETFRKIAILDYCLKIIKVSKCVGKKETSGSAKPTCHKANKSSKL